MFHGFEETRVNFVIVQNINKRNSNQLAWVIAILLQFLKYKLYIFLISFNCNRQWGEGVCGSWGKGSHLGSREAQPARRGKRLAVGFRQWRRRDIARWPKTHETGSPHLQ
jgi:hypothetical protein